MHLHEKGFFNSSLDKPTVVQRLQALTQQSMRILPITS